MSISQACKKMIEQKVQNLSEEEFTDLKKQIVQEMAESYYSKKFGVSSDYLSLFRFIGEGFETAKQLEEHINLPRKVWEKFMAIGFECTLSLNRTIERAKFSKEPKTESLKMRSLDPRYINIPILSLAEAKI